MAKVTIAGTAGSVDVEVADGHTVKDVLIEAARTLGLANPTETVERLAPVVDSQPARLADPVPATASRVTAAPTVRNGS